MKLQNTIVAAILTLAPGTFAAVSDAEMDKFVSDLMSRMTLQEKIGQLNLPSYSDLRSGVVANNDTHNRIRKGLVGGVFNIKGAERVRNLQKLAVEESRLGIPLLMGADVIHGYETIFPIPLGMSCSWDTVAARKSAAVAAAEASATGINWTFNPMVDICRDARWGRIAECNGEDPYLGGVLTMAYVKGYQGSDLSDEKSILACVKHFALYGACESGLDYNYVDMSRVAMFNDYLPPYKAAVDAGVGSLMTSFNVVDRVPATANKWLITDVLRNRLGFDNLVVSDYNGIGEMTTLGIGPKPLCGEMAINAGLDMDMVSEAYLMNLENLVKEGKVSLDKIDNACRRVLEAKYKLGLFKDPYRYCNMKRADKEPFSKEYRKIARELAPETFVLLKNSESLLPLKPQGKIALIGPLANSPKSMSGTWVLSCSTLDRHRTVLDGLRDAVGNKAQILYAQGSNIYLDEKMEQGISQGKLTRGDNEVLLCEALETAKNADIIVAALGESADMSGESASRTRLGLPDAQERLLRELVATGKPVVLLLFTGRPLTLTWEEENVPAILNVWFPGSEAGDAIADVLFGKKSPSGKLTTTFPRAVGQCPIYYNHLPSSRPDPEEGIFNIFNQNWVDESVKPLYPFGYGLNYTTFDYGEIRLNSSTLPSGGELTATVKVTNTGDRDGTEIVQLYLHDVFASEVRPVKQLKGFSRVDLKKGESKDVTFTITEDDLKFYNGNLEHIFEPGEFELMVGPNSRDVKVVRFEALPLANAGQKSDREIQDVRMFIREYIGHTVKECKKDTLGHIALPKPYSVPSLNGVFEKDMFYWDTYFTNIALISDSDFIQARNNVDNILFLIDKYGFMPNGSNVMYLDRSQPPFASMMVRDIYEINKDKKWLASACSILEKEYKFWMEQRITPTGLNRYSNHTTKDQLISFYEYMKSRFSDLPVLTDSVEILKQASHFVAEAESGWDFTPRFKFRCEDFNPVDLNANLYLYEKNFAYFYKELNKKGSDKWLKAADKRKKLLNKYCCNPQDGCFYDYDFVNNRLSPVYSSAVFNLLWSEVLTPSQAAKVVDNLQRLEYSCGLAACERGKRERAYQWDYPNAWASFNVLAIGGLDNYGFKDDARRIARKYVDSIVSIYQQTGNLWEKFNAEHGNLEVNNEYVMPPFMGWTAGAFIYASDYLDRTI